MQGEWFLHNSQSEGWLAVISLIGQHQGAIIVEDIFYFLIQLLAELLEQSFKNNFQMVPALEHRGDWHPGVELWFDCGLGDHCLASCWILGQL